MTNTNISVGLRKRFVKAYVFLKLLYCCEAWNIFKVMGRRIEEHEM